MAIRDGLLAVLAGYKKASAETFAGHPLARLIRGDLAQAVRNSLPGDDQLLLVKGSAGQGNWALGPWVAVFNRLVTESAQRGFYPVYLFAEDMRGMYLSLNQAMTEAKAQYRSDAKTALRARAENFRAMLGPNILPFDPGPIGLAPSAPGNDTAFYEAGNICSVYYPADAVPSEPTLLAHLLRAISLYQVLIDAGAGDAPGDAGEPEKFFEGDGRARVHLRIERNRKLTASVKKLKGTRCEACDLDFTERYGELGRGYIEAHHRVPFAQLHGQAIALDPVTDFVVLCANCHRMIHRLDDPSNLDQLRATLGIKSS